MGGGTNKKWIVRLEDGRIAGPYTTEKVLKKITDGVFTGDESISMYPGGEWISISSQPEFYDLLLDALSGSLSKKPAPDIADRSVHVSQEYKEQTKKNEPASASAELTDQTFDDETAPDRDDDFKSWSMEKTRVSASAPGQSGRDTTVKRQISEVPDSQDSDDIELVDLQNEKKKTRKKKNKLPLIVIIVALVFASLFMLTPTKKVGRLALKRIPFDKPLSLSQQEIQKRTKQAVSHYLKDEVTSYRLAENELVELISADPKNLNLYGILCLTQYELWPHSRQTSEDLAAIDEARQKSSTVNPTHLYAHTCRATSLMIKGQIQEANSFVEQILSSYRGGGNAPIPFYYFKSLLLKQAKDLQTAIGYANSAQKLWPQWLRSYVLEAEIYIEMGDLPSAYKILSAIYKNNKNHSATKVLLGIIEKRQYGKSDRAMAFLKSGLKRDKDIPRDTAAAGYLVLAEIHLESKNQSEALAAAKNSYRFDPTNDTTKNLILRLDKNGLQSTNLKAHELMLEGDQFFRQGDCQSAQAHYKSAFEIDKKLGLAAYKAGKCLWEISFSTEAIEWLKKAIQADPKLVDAYVTLADFYTQRYNFVAAAQTLNAAQKLNRKSHEILRGYALVELRRKNAKAAISYAKQALVIYSNDIESMLILSKAYLLSRSNAQEAFANAAKAIEIDSSHREAQTTYARALMRLQGAEFGIAHLEELVNKYPLVEEYRLALGRILFEDERYSSAEAVFRQLVEIQEKPKGALIELGKVLKVQGQTQEALDSFFRAAVFDPADAEPFFLAGMLLLDAKKPEKAKQQFKRVLKTNPKYPLVHYQIGQAELLLNRPKQALKEAEQEKRQNPNLSAAHVLSAQAYAKMKQFDLCAREYQKAIKINSQGAEIYVQAAACYRQGGNFDSAESLLNIASRQESGNPGIYREQGILFEAKGDFERAVAAYQEYFVLNPNAPDRSLIERRIQGFNR
jgi:tetratricopeptide (TPR) repeat protein